MFLWSTGFIGAKYGTRHADPFTFLSIRFAITLAILFPIIILVLKSDWRNRQFLHSIVSGFFVHGIYLGGVFFVIDLGMPAGISALIVSLQPFATALFAWILLRERLPVRKMFWFLLALAGVYLVLFPSGLPEPSLPGINSFTLMISAISVAAISLGAVYQKRFVQDLALPASTTGQYIGALIPVALVAWILESGEVYFTLEFVLSMVWLIFVLSLGAVVLLMHLIRQGSAASTATLFFLVPVSAAILSWILFDEQLTLVQIIGGLVVVTAVGLASRTPNRNRTHP